MDETVGKRLRGRNVGEAGAEGFVTKPFVENEILTAVDSALKER